VIVGWSTRNRFLLPRPINDRMASRSSHPDNASQEKFLKENNPPPSYAECAYYGIHTFRFVNKDGKIVNGW
jgi:hypothetical protein